MIGENAFFPARQKHVVELQPFGTVQGHQADLGIAGVFLVFHHERHMLEETAQGLEIRQRADQFFQIFQSARCFRGFVLFPHVGVAALVEHRRDRNDVAFFLQPLPPTHELAQQRCHGFLDLAAETASFQQAGGGEG